MNNDKKNKNINMILIVLAVLIIISGSYVLFFKGKNGNSKVADKDIYKEKIEFKSVAMGECGNLYLDSDGKLYFALSTFLEKNSSLQSLARKFNTVKNNIYNEDSIDAILLNMSNINRINYIMEDNSQNDYYLLIMSDGKRYIIYNSDIIVRETINPVEDVEFNTELTVLMSNIGKYGANVEKVIGKEETSDALIGVELSGPTGKTTIYEKKDGKIYIIKDDGEEEELTEEKRNNLSSEFTNAVEKVEEYVEKKYGKNLEKLPKENNIVEIKNGEHVSKEIMEKYGKKQMLDFPAEENVYFCLCGTYGGFSMESERNVCRDVLGYACRTEDEGYINPYLRPNWDGTRVDLSERAEQGRKEFEEEVEKLKNSDEKKRWFWLNGSLSVKEGSSDPSANTKEISKTAEGMDCYGTYKECKDYMKRHSSELNLTSAEVDTIFKTGHRSDYPNPKDYHVDEKANDKTGQPETNQASGKDDSTGETVNPTSTPKPTLRKCDDIDREECNASTGTWNESSCTCTTATPQATAKPVITINPNDTKQT